MHAPTDLLSNCDALHIVNTKMIIAWGSSWTQKPCLFVLVNDVDHTLVYLLKEKLPFNCLSYVNLNTDSTLLGTSIWILFLSSTVPGSQVNSLNYVRNTAHVVKRVLAINCSLRFEKCIQKHIFGYHGGGYSDPDTGRVAPAHPCLKTGLLPIFRAHWSC